ncbi:MAG: hypothetical protein IKA17_01875 [Clostridia bacterium]|nr:hypothetical protein [Clostridia bacterium]
MKLSQTKEIHICSIKRLYLELDENLPDRKTIAILLSMDDVCHPNLKLLDAFHKIGVFDTEMKYKAFSFDYREGMDVKEFLEKQNDFGRIYVCCDSGESRSTAMAAAIMRYYGKSDKEIWTNPHYHPNLLVYKEQLYAFGIKVGKLRLRYLKYINNRALKKAINRKKRR